MVSKIKNMLAFLRLEIVNRVSSLHSDVYSFLYASLLNQNKKHSLNANYSKEVYSLCAAPPSPVNQESPLRDDGDFTPSVLHRHGSEIAGRAKPRRTSLAV